MNVKPAVGAEYTLSTCQLDFCLPARFNLTYIDKDNNEHTPVVIHRAILGSLDRFMAYLIEETMGAFPVWLAPVQALVMPITDRVNDYASYVADQLSGLGYRVETDLRNEKIGYKIREAQLEKTPYMLVVGDKEAQSGGVSVRTRSGEDLGAMPLNAFIARLKEEVDNKIR